jgi:hypothetical protein
MFNLGGLTLTMIPMAAYGLTAMSLFLYSLLIALVYSSFSALKRHHENQPFVDRTKVRTYAQLFSTTKPVLMLAYWMILGFGIYQVIS